MSIRFDRNHINIGTYILRPYARSEKHIRELKECGIDFVEDMDYDVTALDLFQKYGLGAIVTGVVPGWWGGEGENAGSFKQTHPLPEYEAAALRFKDHPAIWGIDVGDEPSALDFPHYGKVIQRVREMFPQRFAFLNLYPSYAFPSDKVSIPDMLGTQTFGEYIESFCGNVDTDYICYDFYVYSNSVANAYENLRIAADACKRHGRSLWIVLQVNSNVPKQSVTLNELRFQAHTALAFGAECILWACYTAGWWYNQVLDENGEKTQQYERLKKVNTELHALSERYMLYRRTQTHFVGFDNTEWLNGVGQKSETAYSDGVVSGLRAEDGRPLLIGEMRPRSEKAHDCGMLALFVTACDDPYDKNNTNTRLVFDLLPGCGIRAYSGSGEPAVDHTDSGRCTVYIRSNEGMLLEIFEKTALAQIK